MLDEKTVPHIHANLIKLWADGELIQQKIGSAWENVYPSWDADFEYRVEPVVIEPRVIDVSMTLSGIAATYPNLRLTFDGETDELIGADLLVRSD